MPFRCELSGSRRYNIIVRIVLQTRSRVTMSDLTFWACEFTKILYLFSDFVYIATKSFPILQLPSSTFRRVLLRNDHNAL